VPLKKLIRVVWQNIARSKKNFIFSSIGIIVGITTFTFFLALSQGIRDRVLNRIFPIDQLEIEPMGGVGGGVDDEKREGGLGDVLATGPRRLNASAIKQINGIEGVEQVYPKMRARFAARIETGILNKRMAGEGFFEGLELSEDLVTGVREFEEACSSRSEDICHRREVSCIRNRDCPHEGMECREGRCRPRQYWRSFRDRHDGRACTRTEICSDSQVCGYDVWIVLKTDVKEHIAAVRKALADLKHPTLDVDIYLAVAEVGVVTKKDIASTIRASGELWTIGVGLDDQATAAAAPRPPPTHHFPTVDAATQYIAGLADTLTEGRCVGRPCMLTKAESAIGSWKYFEIADNHRADCPQGLYCEARNVLSRQGRCESYMPLALNPLLIDFYNSSVVSQIGTATIPNPCLVFGLKGFFRLGFSYLGKSSATVWQRIRWAEVVGFSDKAMQVGATTPLAYVERFNHFYLGPDAVSHYDSVLLQIPRNEEVASVIEAVQKQSFDLSSRSKFARKAGEMLLIVTLTFLLISIIIIVISAMNISHTFLIMIYQRQYEFGIMRAIGASSWDIRKIILGESLLIGLVGGIIGNIASFALSRLVNLLAGGLRERFPVIPDDFFVYSFVLVAGSIGFALLFCVVGAWVPAQRASNLDPAVVLTSA